MAALEIHQCEAPAIVTIFFVSGATDALLGAVPAGRKPLTPGLGSPPVFFYTREMNMAKSGQPFAGISDMMTRNFEQTRKAMEKYADLFEKGIKASHGLMPI